MKDSKSLYLNSAWEWMEQSTCLRRMFGAVLVDEEYDEIVCGSYNGAPKKMPHCDVCLRNLLNIPSGTEYSVCRSCHAEENLMIKAGKRTENKSIYLRGYDIALGREIYPKPCFWCTKLMINAGIKRIVTINAIYDPIELYHMYIQSMMKGITIPTFDP